MAGEIAVKTNGDLSPQEAYAPLRSLCFKKRKKEERKEGRRRGQRAGQWLKPPMIKVQCLVVLHTVRPTCFAHKASCCTPARANIVSTLPVCGIINIALPLRYCHSAHSAFLNEITEFRRAGKQSAQTRKVRPLVPN